MWSRSLFVIKIYSCNFLAKLIPIYTCFESIPFICLLRLKILRVTLVSIHWPFVFFSWLKFDVWYFALIHSQHIFSFLCASGVWTCFRFDAWAFLTSCRCWRLRIVVSGYWVHQYSVCRWVSVLAHLQTMVYPVYMLSHVPTRSSMCYWGEYKFASPCLYFSLVPTRFKYFVSLKWTWAMGDLGICSALILLVVLLRWVHIPVHFSICLAVLLLALPCVTEVRIYNKSILKLQGKNRCRKVKREHATFLRKKYQWISFQSKSYQKFSWFESHAV